MSNALPLFFGEDAFFRGMGFELIDDGAVWYKKFAAEPEPVIILIHRPKLKHGFWVIKGVSTSTPYRMCRWCDDYKNAEGKVKEVVETLREKSNKEEGNENTRFSCV